MLKRLRARIAKLRGDAVTRIEPRRKMRFETLEPRILLSADLGMEHPDLAPQDQTTTVAIEQPLDQTAVPAASSSDDNLAADRLDLARSTELVFVDPSVGDYESLLDGLRNPSGNLVNYKVHLLTSGEDGFGQISDILQKRGDVNALHILSHGSEGEVRLGGSVLNAETASLHADDLGKWGEALSENGDILLYGCNVTAGEQGIAFIESLSALTGADVAASGDATGSANLRGDWDLEHTVGFVQAETLSFGTYDALMSGFTSTSADETFVGTAGGDTYFFSDDWGTDTVTDIGGAVDTLDFSDVTTDMTVTFHADGSVSAASGASILERASGLEKIVAGSGVNTFVFENGATFTGTIAGGTGANILDFSALASNLTVTFNDDGSLVLGAGGSSVAYTGSVATLLGGLGNDTFVFKNGAAFAGALDGGAGTNTVDFSAFSADLRVTFHADGTLSVADADGLLTQADGMAAFIGGAGNDTFAFAENATYAGSINGGTGANALDYSLSKASLTVTFKVDGSLTLVDGSNTATYFGSLATVLGGSGNDTFVFKNGATHAGSINGGSGINTVDFSDYATPVLVDLAGGTMSVGGTIVGTSMTGFSGATTVDSLNLGAGLDTSTLTADTTLASLGVTPKTLTASTLLSSLNDGAGVALNFWEGSAHHPV